MHQETFLDAQKMLEFHEMMLNDELFHESVRRRISKDLMNTEWAITEEADYITRHLESSGDPYLQARIEDIWDMVHNILLSLSLSPMEYSAETKMIGKEHILVSQNLFLSEVMKARRFQAGGLVTKSNAVISHAAILLRSFNIPSLGNVKDLETKIKNGDEMIVDGIKGQLILRPTKMTLDAYHSLQRRILSSAHRREYLAPETRTRDGTKVRLLGNIDNYRQIDLLVHNSLEGIGLFRTEFLLFETESFPGEEEQYRVYKKIMEAMSGRQVVMRTFDIGADKRTHYLERCMGQNPALGIRGIRRHLLRHPDELHTQLRAMLRAAAGFSIDILFPMITTMEDVSQSVEHLNQVKKDLATEGVPFSSKVRIGVMIEVPSAAIAVEKILSAVDFISIGTNDLIQYFTAADRDNEAVHHYGDIKNDSVLFLLRYIIEQAIKMDRVKDVTICGEIASEPENISILLSIGYRSLSISPVQTEAIRSAVMQTEL